MLFLWRPAVFLSDSSLSVWRSFHMFVVVWCGSTCIPSLLEQPRRWWTHDSFLSSSRTISPSLCVRAVDFRLNRSSGPAFAPVSPALLRSLSLYWACSLEVGVWIISCYSHSNRCMSYKLQHFWESEYNGALSFLVLLFRGDIPPVKTRFESVNWAAVLYIQTHWFLV